MLSPHSIKRFPGLFGSSNPSRPPEGATDIDQETVRRSLDVAEPRRGYKASAAAGGPINAIAFKQGMAIAITYDTPSNTGALRLYNPGLNTWTNLPMNPGTLTIDRPGIPGAHSRFVSAQKALYFQSRYGLTKVEDISTNVCRTAVQPKWWSRLDGASFIGNTTTNAWLPDGSQAAYRYTICRFGANGELIESEPGERRAYQNTSGGARSLVVTIVNAYGQPPDSFFRLYRSASVLNAVDPSDEMFLVAELKPNASALDPTGTGFLSPDLQVSAGYNDVTPDASLYVPLYTNPRSGFGIAQADTPAQLGADVAWFKNRLHLLNTSDVQRLTVKVIGTGVGGLNAGDWIVVNGFKVPLVSEATPPGSTFANVYTSGTVAQNIENTARSIARLINFHFGGYGTIVPAIPASVDSGPPWNKLFAYYVSVSGTDAGQIVLASAYPGAQTFAVQTSSSIGWDRDYSAGTTSSPNAQAAGWSWSSFGQPEANPTANNNPIGDPTAAGQRLIALRDTLFAFKQDGLWAITDDGSISGPSVRLVDPTIRLIAPETAVALDNFIIALCDQGIVLISETGGVANISHEQIERELFKLMAYVGSATLAERAFGVAYTPEHTYILALPESPNATSCTKQYVFNLQSRAWDSWAIPGGVLCGAVHPDTGQLYFGRPDGTLAIERKDFAATDYQDPGFTIASPTAAQTKTLIFSGDLRTGATSFVAGDIVQQFQSMKALAQKVVSVSYSSSLNQTTVTLDAVPRYAWDQVTLLTIVKAIPVVMRLLPLHASEPLTDKDWGDCYLSFRYCDLDFLSVGMASEKVPLTNTAVERVNNADGSSAPITLDPWGSGAWGAKPWGRQAKDLVLKCTMPQDFAYAAQLTLTLSLPCALSRFELSAIDVKIAGETDRVVR